MSESTWNFSHALFCLKLRYKNDCTQNTNEVDIRTFTNREGEKSIVFPTVIFTIVIQKRLETNNLEREADWIFCHAHKLHPIEGDSK